MGNKLLTSLHCKGLLSFGPGSEPLRLGALNVLIGPNGSGKSNLIEAIELLRAAPGDLAGAVRMGGRPMDWIWKAGSNTDRAAIRAHLEAQGELPELVYSLAFTESGGRFEIVEEALEQVPQDDPNRPAAPFYYQLREGRPVIRTRATGASFSERALPRESIHPEQSVLRQKRDQEHYPELFAAAQRFEAIAIFREWGFGRGSVLRQPQPADLPGAPLLPGLENLGLVLNSLEHTDRWPRLEQLMSRFLPRYKKLSTRVIPGGAVQIHLHEEGLRTPLPATRLSDGTLRFLALLAILLNAESSSLVCIEEPELGLHPDSMALMADLLVEASGKTQLIVTTHSDALVSALTEHVESILVCEFLEQGTTLHRLEKGKLKFWLEQYRLGEIWRIGKVGGNPW